MGSGEGNEELLMDLHKQMCSQFFLHPLKTQAQIPPPSANPRAKRTPSSTQRLFGSPLPRGYTRPWRFTHLLEIGASPAAQEKEGRSEKPTHTAPLGVKHAHPLEGRLRQRERA